MADTPILTKQELNYIETLYLQTRLENFIVKTSTYNDWLLGDLTTKQIEEMYVGDKYKIMLGWVCDNILIHCKEPPKEAKGYAWYDLPSYRLGIMEYDKAKKSNNFNAVIQYKWEHLYSLNPELDGLDLPFGGTRDQYHFKRTDITKIFKSSIDYTIGYNYISPYRNKNGHNRKEETIYLGNRKNGNVYRMYPKTLELLAEKDGKGVDYNKIELLSKYFGDIEDLYTFELELHRSYLRDQLKITTLDQLDQVYAAYHSIVGKIRIYEDTDHNKSLIKQNNRTLIDAYTITDYVEYKKVYRGKYKRSLTYLQDRKDRADSNYIESMKLTEEEIRLFRIGEAERLLQNIEKGKKKLTITYEDSESELDYNDMKEKHEFERINQGNELYTEAKKTFTRLTKYDMEQAV